METITIIVERQVGSRRIATQAVLGSMALDAGYAPPGKMLYSMIEKLRFDLDEKQRAFDKTPALP